MEVAVRCKSDVCVVALSVNFHNSNASFYVLCVLFHCGCQVIIIVSHFIVCY